MNEHPKTRKHKRGFTLIEILIVLVILGVLATVVIAQFRNARGDAEKAAFYINGYKFVEAAARYRLDTGEFLEDSGSGQLPEDFEQYIRPEQWLAGTPIGGVWDAELNDHGVTSAIGVHFNGTGATRDDAYMQEIDAKIDDGDLATGGFQQIDDDRYYFIIKD